MRWHLHPLFTIWHLFHTWYLTPTPHLAHPFLFVWFTLSLSHDPHVLFSSIYYPHILLPSLWHKLNTKCSIAPPCMSRCCFPLTSHRLPYFLVSPHLQYVFHYLRFSLWLENKYHFGGFPQFAAFSFFGWNGFAAYSHCQKSCETFLMYSTDAVNAGWEVLQKCDMLYSTFL